MPKGTCKLCSSARGSQLRSMARNGVNAADAQKYAAKYDISFTRQTWYQHVEHCKPKALVIKEKYEELEELGALQVKKTTNTEFLETMRDIGMAHMSEDPGIVKPETALKAVQILESRKDNRGDQLNILINVLTGKMPNLALDSGEVIEGEVRELPSGEDYE